MRATSHNGRFGTAKHNGRNFDLNKAAHIDQTKTGQNFYWFWDKAKLGKGDNPELFEGSEIRYYNQQFSQALAEQNERHIKARHEERIKTMDDWLTGRNTRPEESIYQIGDMYAVINPKYFKAAAGELLNWLNDWSRQHGRPYRILNVAGHMDEKSFHMQVRRVWQYQDEDGNWHIGQNKALDAAGVELPEPDKPIGPKNNRKITFDRMVREKWIEICEKYGYQIERTPNDKHTEHMGKEALIELNEKKAELDKAIQEAQEAREEARGVFTQAKGIQATSEAVTAFQRALPGQQRSGLEHLQGF